MKIKPNCPVFKVFAKAAGIKPPKPADDEDEETSSNIGFKILDASDHFVNPPESWAQTYIKKNG